MHDPYPISESRYRPGRAVGCVVTGAAGFLGRHLAERLSKAEYRVCGLGHGSVPDGGSALAEFVEVDLPCREVTELLHRWQPQVFIHAAGPGELDRRPDQSVPARSKALAAWVSVLEAVRKAVPRCHVILISSAAVYGRPGRLPVSEDQSPAPTTPYGQLKLDCEVAAERYALEYGLWISVARVFNAYGPGQRRQLFWDFCNKAVEAREGVVELLGDGTDERDFVHVEDVTRAILHIACATGHAHLPYHRSPRRLAGELETGGTPHRLETGATPSCYWNVGSGRSDSVRHVAEEMARQWPHPIAVRFDGQRQMQEIQRIGADISRLQSLGYSPRWSLRRGLEEYVTWFLQDQAVAV